MKSIAVYCGSSLGNKDVYSNSARELGAAMAKMNSTLIYGGAKIGIMGAVADSVLNSGGKAIGILPNFLSTKEVAHEKLTELIEVETMHERKSLMYEKAEGFITLPGGFGTFEELFEMTTWGQLGLHYKPIGVLNVDGYYDHLFLQLEQMVSAGFLKQENLDMILTDSNVIGLLDKMLNYKPVINTKWISDIDQT